MYHALSVKKQIGGIDSATSKLKKIITCVTTRPRIQQCSPRLFNVCCYINGCLKNITN